MWSSKMAFAFSNRTPPSAARTRSRRKRSSITLKSRTGRRADFLSTTIAAKRQKSRGRSFANFRRASQVANRDCATMESDPTKAYNQDDATGFIRLNALRLEVAAKVQRKKLIEGSRWRVKIQP